MTDPVNPDTFSMISQWISHVALKPFREKISQNSQVIFPDPICFPQKQKMLSFSAITDDITIEVTVNTSVYYIWYKVVIRHRDLAGQHRLTELIHFVLDVSGFESKMEIKNYYCSNEIRSVPCGLKELRSSVVL